MIVRFAAAVVRAALCALLLFASALFASAAAGEGRRVALVIGNGDYANAGRLQNPPRDAEAISDALKQLGFEVFLSKDLDQAHFATALTEYLDALNGAEVGMFYFAGHGIQINGQNFLLSTNATGENEFMIPSEGMELASVIAKIEQRTPVALVFVDACRNNPLADRLLNQNPVSARTLGLTRGLARLDQLGRNTLVAYATAPNQTAADGIGIHSPFTSALLTHIDTPGLEVSAMLKRVARDVLDATGNQQQPEVVATMTEEFYFMLEESAATEETPAPGIDGVEQRRIAAETAFAFAEKLGTVEAYRFFLDAYSDTPLAEAANVAIAALEEEARNRPQIEIDSAFPNVASPGGTAEEEAALNLTLEDRKGIQIILSTLGYDTRGIDGQFGGGTRNAIKAFQLALNHEPTGYLSRAEYDYIAASQDRVRETLGDKAMRITVADLPLGADARLTKAVEALKSYPIKFGFFEGNLYVAVISMTKWDAARRIAQKAGGDLAVITSKRENDFIYSLIESDSSFWWIDRPEEMRGGAREFFASGPYFGLYQAGSARTSRDGWTWVDESTGGYTNWYSGQPNEVQLYSEVGAGAFGGETTGYDQPLSTWQDPRLFTQQAPGFIIEIGPMTSTG